MDHRRDKAAHRRSGRLVVAAAVVLLAGALTGVSSATDPAGASTGSARVLGPDRVDRTAATKAAAKHKRKHKRKKHKRHRHTTSATKPTPAKPTPVKPTPVKPTPTKPTPTPTPPPATPTPTPPAPPTPPATPTPTPPAPPTPPATPTPTVRSHTDLGGPSNTGVPPGTRLTVHEGDLDIRKAGTVIDGLDVHGAIKVNAPDVTIRNSIIRFRPGGYVDGIHSYSTGLDIIDTEIAPTVASPDYNGIMGSGFTALGVDVHGVVDSVHVYGDDVTIQSSWLHGNTHFLQDPHWNGNPSHDDSIQIVSGKNIRILSTTYDGAYNSGIQITQDSGTVSDVTIAANLAGGGGCSINVSEKGGGAISGISITGNRFTRDQRLAGCAIIRPRTTVVAAAGNTWADDGTPAALKNG